mmetsp:Transcript_11945/g.20313  ORF Transcript_11945/g.20313 Transcript_11945/m.20313 type:complete len:458 (+) Transcript_11945:92-1465(+)
MDSTSDDQVSGSSDLRVRKVTIKGNARTRAYVIEDELQQAYQASTVEEVYIGLQYAVQRLNALGIFSSIEITMDAAPEAKDGSKQTDVIVILREKDVLQLRAGTYTALGRESDVSLETAGALRNPTGHGELVSGASSFARSGSSTARLGLAKPRVAGLDVGLEADLRSDLINMEEHSSYSEVCKGGSIALATHDGRHRAALSAGRRDARPRRHPAVPYAHDASLSIISQAKPSFKTSLEYAFTDDNRDSRVNPTQGTFFEAKTECAGLMGDVDFIKAEVRGQRHWRLPVGGAPLIVGQPGPALALSFHSGVIRPIGTKQQGTLLNDRFFMGGPTSLRGFHYCGVGPRAAAAEGGAPGGDALGGDAFLRAAAALSVPVPARPLAAYGLRAQAFVNAGTLETWGTPLPAMARRARVSAGVGLVLPTVFGRIEIDYSWILKKLQNDKTRNFQIGIGIQYE